MNHSTSKTTALVGGLLLLAGCGAGDAEAESVEPSPTVTVTETATPEPEQEAEGSITGDDIWLMIAYSHVEEIHAWFDRLQESDCAGQSQACPDLFAEGAELMDGYGDWLSNEGADQTPEFVPDSHLQDVNLTTMAMEDLATGEPGTESYEALYSQTTADVRDILNEANDWVAD